MERCPHGWGFIRFVKDSVAYSCLQAVQMRLECLSRIKVRKWGKHYPGRQDTDILLSSHPRALSLNRWFKEIFLCLHFLVYNTRAVLAATFRAFAVCQPESVHRAIFKNYFNFPSSLRWCFFFSQWYLCDLPSDLSLNLFLKIFLKTTSRSLYANTFDCFLHRKENKISPKVRMCLFYFILPGGSYYKTKY